MIRITKKVFDSTTNLISSKSDLDFDNYLSRTHFTDLEKSGMKHYLENLCNNTINKTKRDNTYKIIAC